MVGNKFRLLFDWKQPDGKAHAAGEIVEGELFRSAFDWTQPDGKTHKAGEIAALDKAVVFDWEDLIKYGTLERATVPVADATGTDNVPWKHLAASVTAGEAPKVEGR